MSLKNFVTTSVISKTYTRCKQYKPLVALGLICSLVLSILLMLPYFKKTRAEWVRFEDNPIIPNNVDKKELINNPRSPAILIEDGIIKMWFINQISNKWHIDYIYSKDGISWIKPYNLPLISPYNNEVLIGEPTIIKVNNKYHLWFTSLKEGNSIYTIKYASSDDGYIWLRREEDIITPTKWWETYGVVNPYVLYVNNKYLMWYGGWGSDRIWRIGFAYSNDGINWMKHEEPLNISPNLQHVGNHNLKFFDNTYYLWYLTGDGSKEAIYELTSTNGIDWDCKKESCLIFRKNTSYFPNNILNDTETLKIGNKIFLYFAGIHNNKWGIGLLSNLPFFSKSPLILLPGLMASWNKEAILYNKAVGVFDWKLLPFVKEYDGIINTLKNLAT